MYGNENRAVSAEEQSKGAAGGSEEQAGENASSNAHGGGGELRVSAMKKKMSKIKSRIGPKSRTTIIRKNDSESDRKVPEVEPIVAPAAVALGRLKDEYYHDLRFALVPPAADRETEEGWSADGRLREMRDAIDEMDRTLDGANLSLFGCSCSCPGVPSALGGGGAVEMAPFSDRRPKPRTGVEMKSYRLGSNGDRV